MTWLTIAESAHQLPRVSIVIDNDFHGSRRSRPGPYPEPVIVSHRHQFVFLKPRKVAGTSVEIALSRVCGPDDVVTPLWPPDEELRRAEGGGGPRNYQSPPLARDTRSHTPARLARDAIGAEAWGDYTKVSIVRDPWDTVASLYFWRSGRFRRWSFDRFVAHDVVATLARRNQRTFRIRGRIVADRVLRYERLAEEVADLWVELSLPGEPSLPRAKSQFRPEKVEPRSLYGDETRDRVAVLFAKTIRDFGYTF